MRDNGPLIITVTTIGGTSGKEPPYSQSYARTAAQGEQGVPKGTKLVA